MGLGRFLVRFFSGQKFTKFDLALTLVIKKHSKVGYTRSMMFLRIWLKNFIFVKSLMGTPLDWKFFTLKKKSHFHLLQGQTRAQKKSSSELDARYPIPNCFSPWSFLTHIKNPMGLEGFLWMESLFVGQKKVAWIDLALSLVSENQSKLAQRFFIMFRTIWQRDFFDVKSLVGIALDWDFFPETNFLKSI